MHLMDPRLRGDDDKGCCDEGAFWVGMTSKQLSGQKYAFAEMTPNNVCRASFPRNKRDIQEL